MTKLAGQTKNNPRIYSIHSQKGGVGKTSIAIAIAGFEAIFNKNRKVLLIDADLTGTSLKDIIKSNGVDRYINELILADPDSFIKFTEIIPDGNSVTEKEIFTKEYCWKYADRSYSVDNLFFIPSSPKYHDINAIIPLISQEDYLHFFRLRFEDIILKAIKEGFESIIIDLPPGFFGLSLSILDLCVDQITRNLMKIKDKSCEPTRLELFYNSFSNHLNSFIEAKPIFVSSSDDSDFKTLIPLICNYLLEENQKARYAYDSRDKDKNKLKYDLLMKFIFVVFNKLYKLKEDNMHRRDPFIRISEIFSKLKEVSKEQKIEVPNCKKVVELIEKKILKEGTNIFNYIEGFEITKILSTISRIKENPERNGVFDEGMEVWCNCIYQYFSFNESI